MSIFQKSVIKNYLAGIDREQSEKAYEIFQKNYSPEKIEIIKKLKEEEYQDGFLRDIFADVLGYTLKPEEGFNLVREFKNQSDAGKADGAILKKDKAIAVIELKSAKTKDLKMITEQAFSYKNKQPGCKYVITSNFQKLHFYIDYANEYEEFDLFRLDREDFERMFLILCKDSILHDRPEKLKKESVSHEEKVSKQLYADYSVFRKKLFENLVRNNPEIDKLTLFSKSQTLIDRFLFILFAEDKGLLPPNSINRIIERFHTLKREDAYKPLYEIYKQYFGYMNTGRPGKRAVDDIPAYNGGLFYPDELLYDLKIDDDILIEDLRKLSAYDFDTEVDVNILGHIFEHSLSEIEETTARIKGIDLDKSKSRRKKDGIFYTPQYITQYIVDNTIGRLCREKRKELEMEEIEVDDSFYTKKGNLSKKGSGLYQKTEDYKNWLLSLKILDPACGSGAFLNQALSFLIREHNFIIEIQTDLKKGQVSMFNVEKAVLENNLYGVDINAESVEITKLSLWLRTAHRERKLSNLNSNIRCGNSLIDDPEIAGDKAFHWEKEFPEIMESGGFDVVIGNPPYVLCQPSNTEKKTLEFYKTFEAASYKIDLFHLFYEKSLNLLKIKGKLGFITPNTFLTNKYIKSLRTFILNNSNIEHIVLFDDGVFHDASVDVSAIILSKEKLSGKISISKMSKKGLIFQINHKNQIDWIKNEDHIFNVKDEFINIDKDGFIPLKEIASVTFGLQTKDKKEFVAEFKKEDDWEKCLTGKNINRYFLEKTELYFKNKPDIVKAGGSWDMNIHHSKKIVVRQIGNPEPIFAFDNIGIAALNTMYCIVLYSEEYSYKYLLAILNSSFMKKYWQYHYSDNKQLFPKIKGYQIKEIPIKEIKKEVQQPFIKKADIMLSKNRELHELKTGFLNFLTGELSPQKISKKLQNWNELDPEQFTKEITKCKVREINLKERREWQDYFTEQKEKAHKIKSLIDSTDKEIDKMVYELYGLTPEEIKTVESMK